jgi:hypothetical protein
MPVPEKHVEETVAAVPVGERPAIMAQLMQICLSNMGPANLLVYVPALAPYWKEPFVGNWPPKDLQG